MRIAIMGSGGLGGYFGARLVQGGADVHFVARGKHLEAMRAGGLRIQGPQPIHVPKVNATNDPREIGVADVVMLCVKLWDTESAIEHIRPMVGPGTAIISFQNGVLKDQYLRAAFDERQLMGGVGY
ncbi:MAG TPA: 2-dehydropantoate 2-reductase, partial [Ramlibacter sp.]|nr:2-dehydropantoate 2-reductase [Ramlibacter sp.]